MTTTIKAPTYLVSRDTDLLKLKSIWEQIKKDNLPGYIFLLGEPGIGKSTLCNGFLAQLEKQKDAPLIAAVRCNSFSGGYDPIRDIFWELFERGEGMGLSGMELAQAIIKQAPAWFSILVGHPVFALVTSAAEGMKIAYEHIIQKNQVFEQASVHRQFSRFLQTIAETRKLIIFIDDLHNADSSTLSLIESFPHSLNSGCVLFIFASRYSTLSLASNVDNAYNERLKYVIASGVSKGAHKIELVNGLDIEEYLAVRYPGLHLSQSLLNQIIKKTEGHPLFVEKLLSLWEQNGAITNVRHGTNAAEWALSPASNTIDIPEALNGLIEMQFSSLALDLRRLLQMAAVEGENFTVQVLSTLLSEKLLEITQKIQMIGDESRLVKPYQSLRYGKVVFDFYAFFHGFIYEYIYSRKLDQINKRQLHLNIGNIMEQLYADQDYGPIAAQLGRHFREGMDYEKSVNYYLIAAKYEQSRYAWDASQRMCEEGMLSAGLIAGQVSTHLINLLETSVQGYSAVGMYHKVIEQYEKAIDLAIKTKDSPEHIAFMCQDVSDYLDTQGELQKASYYIDLGLKVLGTAYENSFSRLWLEARTARLISREKGKKKEAVQLLKSVIEKAESLPQDVMRDKLLYETYNYLGPELFLTGFFSDGKAALIRSAEIASQLGMTQDSRTAMLNIAYNIIDHGEFHESLQIARQALQDALDAGMLEDQAYCYVIIGGAQVGLGEYPEAIANLKKGIAMFEDLGNNWNDPYSYYDLAKAYLDSGDTQAANDAAKKSLLSAQLDSDDFDPHEHAVGYEVLGRVQAELGDWEGAETSFKKAIKLMREEGASFEKARSQKFYGLALLKKGDAGQGVKLLKSSLTTMKRMKVAYEVNLIRDILSKIQE